MKSLRPPAKNKIGARILVLQEYSEKAAEMFEQAGFTPIYTARRESNAVDFWFAKMPDDMIFRLSSSIPREFFAQQAIIGKVS